jgi:asparagine synthase (glutamine-hydrolysing)
MLVGEGGDELGGYPVYSQLNKYHKVFKIIPNFLWRLLSLVSKRIGDEFEVYSHSNDYSIRRFIFGFKEHEKRKFWNVSTGLSNSYEVLQTISNEITDDFDDAFYRKILNVEYKLRLSELILPRIDYPSMAASIEARAPFMDHDLIEFTSQLPFSQKMANGPKSLIKKIAAKYLPEYITNAPKVGFGQLLRPFFTSTLPEWYKSEILDTAAPIRTFVKLDALKEVYDKKDYSYRMWLLYSLNKWLVVNNDARNL